MPQESAELSAEMATTASKRASDILAPFVRISASFGDYENDRRAHVRELLRRVLVNVGLQQELCAEMRIRRQGYPTRSEYPDWALRLAEVIRNPEHKYSRAVRELVFQYGKQLHEESADPGNTSALATYLTTELDVPVLSAIARELSASVRS